jgi:hypothetical protein
MQLVALWKLLRQVWRPTFRALPEICGGPALVGMAACSKKLKAPPNIIRWGFQCMKIFCDSRGSWKPPNYWYPLAFRFGKVIILLHIKPKAGMRTECSRESPRHLR